MEKLDLRYQEKNGRWRNGKAGTCKHCQKDFVTRLNSTGVYCSRECSLGHRRNGKLVTCAVCEKETYRTKYEQTKSKSGVFFCSEDCKNEAQRIGGVAAIQPAHYGTGKGCQSYRRTYRTAYPGPLFCVHCDRGDHEKIIDIHHIDESHDNMDPSNLVALCKPCHQALHLDLWQLTEEVLARRGKQPLPIASLHFGC